MRGHVSPDAAFWGRQIEVGMILVRKIYEMSNVSGVLIITTYKMPHAIGCYPVAKSHQDHQGFAKE